MIFKIEDLARTSPYFLDQLIEVMSLNTEITNTRVYRGMGWGQ